MKLKFVKIRPGVAITVLKGGGATADVVTENIHLENKAWRILHLAFIYNDLVQSRLHDLLAVSFQLQLILFIRNDFPRGYYQQIIILYSR